MEGPRGPTGRRVCVFEFISKAFIDVIDVDVFHFPQDRHKLMDFFFLLPHSRPQWLTSSICGRSR